MLTKNIDIDSVKSFLIKEYGYLSDIMEETTECQLIELSIDSIVYSNKPRLNALIRSDLSLYEDVSAPVIVRRLRNVFVLVDGYHRLAHKIQKNIKTISCIVVS